VRKITSEYQEIIMLEQFKSSSLVNEKLSSITYSGKYTGDLWDFTYKLLSRDPEINLSILPVLDDSV
jgi:hypothetical protein